MLDRVTITGADDNTSVKEMAALSAEFPFVEWGILVSKKREGTRRYPGSDWHGLLWNESSDQYESGNRMKFSMHVCGSWARQIFAGETNWSELPLTKYLATRIQINGTPGTSSTGKSLAAWKTLKQYIVQYPRAHDFIAGGRVCGFDMVPLFDESGGEGIVRESWPPPVDGAYCGYAGGIGPDNVVDVVGKINSACKSPFWIDMEGRVRTDDSLDMDKVRTVLELCAPLVGSV